LHDNYKIVGTAGHIDHGKSALVRALTGTDPDRLQEERERGITIDLGFAHLQLDGGTRVGFVDVPGHERFVKNMLAGIGGIDTVLLVVAADESIMPQTREHLAICELLGVDSGVVAITKADLVDDEIAELVELEVRELLAESLLAEAPIVRTSATSGAGLDALRSALATTLAATATRPGSPFVRLPVDRVFTMRGFGTVVTGTLLSGQVSAGDRLELLPDGTAVTVRGVQVYGETVDTATAGQRTAVNLQGIDIDAVTRGDLLVTPGCLAPTHLIDARLRLLPEHGLERLQRVRFHHGAAEILCRVALLEGNRIEPGDSGFVQLRLESPYACVPGDRFVVRRYSPMLTIGGGVVLDTAPAKHRPSDNDVLALLASLEDAPPVERLAALVASRGTAGATEEHLRRRLFATTEELEAWATSLSAERRVLTAQHNPLLLIDGARAAPLEQTVLAVMRAYHDEHALARTVPKSVLAAALPRRLPEAVLDALVRDLAARGEIHEGAEGVSVAGHQVSLSEDQKHVRDALVQLYDAANWAPPSLDEAWKQLGTASDEVFHLLVRTGELVRLRDDLVFHATRLEVLADELRSRYAPGDSFSVADFKEWTGVSRKHAIPLLEYLDEHRVTRREGDRRVRL
jgi:selenocysteine-specific elongation factor